MVGFTRSQPLHLADEDAPEDAAAEIDGRMWKSADHV